MTLEEILKRLRKSARGYERAVKIGKTCADLTELIKELKAEGLSESNTVCVE